MASVDIEFLRNLSFLQGANPDVLKGLVEMAAERRFEKGQVILQEGSAGHEMYVIVEGQVEVVKGHGDDELVLATRHAGDFIGEMALIDARPRFATVRAQEPTRVLEFTEQQLRFILDRQPLLLYQSVRMLTARLRESDVKMIADLKRKNLQLARALRELQEAQAGLREKERLERELELARDLQQSILPQDFPILPGFSCATRNEPARQVGGDFYDVISLSKGRVGLVMADVSDKGMAAALYMALARSLIHAEAKRSSSPRRVLLSVHRLLLEMTQADMFLSAFYGVLDPAQGTLRYARAGHDRPLLYSPSTGQCQFLAADGMLLGCFDEVRLEEAGENMHPGDLLVLYSDGITDANSPQGEFFGVERLRDTVCAAEGLSARDLCDGIYQQVKDFQAGATQYDDIALLVVKADTG